MKTLFIAEATEQWNFGNEGIEFRPADRIDSIDFDGIPRLFRLGRADRDWQDRTGHWKKTGAFNPVRPDQYEIAQESLHP